MSFFLSVDEAELSRSAFDQRVDIIPREIESLQFALLGGTRMFEQRFKSNLDVIVVTQMRGVFHRRVVVVVAIRSDLIMGIVGNHVTDSTIALRNRTRHDIEIGQIDGHHDDIGKDPFELLFVGSSAIVVVVVVVGMVPVVPSFATQERVFRETVENLCRHDEVKSTDVGQGGQVWCLERQETFQCHVRVCWYGSQREVLSEFLLARIDERHLGLFEQDGNHRLSFISKNRDIILLLLLLIASGEIKRGS